METPTAPFQRGAHVRVKGRAGTWVVVRDTGGALVIIRHSRETTSAPRANITPTKGKVA